jgi:formate hydrogenlyase transcriptional activator
MPPTAATELEAVNWLFENGPGQLEQLFWVVLYRPSEPILITDDGRRNLEANSGAARLLGVSPDRIVGRRIDDFVDPNFRPEISRIWRSLLEQGTLEGTLKLMLADGGAHEIAFTANSNVLPGRHLLALHDIATAKTSPQSAAKQQATVSSSAKDCAVFLLEASGRIVKWYAGAERIYGYNTNDAVGQHVCFLYPEKDSLQKECDEALKRVAADGHLADEGWHLKKNGTKFWANVITTALWDENGALQGFGRVVRDFSDRHERDEKLRRRVRTRPLPPRSTIAGVVSGEFDRTSEANDAFLELVGYSREDLLIGRLHWPDLTPIEYAPLDELAHEEALRFGACTPYEKELVRHDGARVPVLVTTAVLKFSPFRWITFVQDLQERDRLESVEEEHTQPKQEFEEIVGASPALRRVQRQVEIVAPTDATVLVLGETGTGKELVARAIHRMSSRRNLPFVSLNCAAIPTGLLESELFGYERGAFTGALSQKIGRFEMAHRGTLFLDEVGDIPLDVQPKLLRALQEKSFERLGGTKTIPIDVRLIAATNRNLTQMMGDQLFRSDLYYRLKVFPITTPPLRDHPEDIPILARYFTKKYAAKMGRNIEKIPSDTMRALVNWPWPGNVRELENFIERSVILSNGPNLRAPLEEIRPSAMPSATSATLEQVEREHIIKVLRESNAVVTNAATRLGLHRTTLNAIMRKLGISRKDL